MQYLFLFLFPFMIPFGTFMTLNAIYNKDHAKVMTWAVITSTVFGLIGTVIILEYF